MEPANGKWWPINDEDEREAVKAHIETMDEYLVSDVNLEFSYDLTCTIPSEMPVDDYLELSESLEGIEWEDDMIKALLILEHDTRYYMRS